ncbi:putative porin [Acidobacteriia bacterium AH_259_A11_L15]|nr:putative porin [Acidobacteriia bacterium AH_259_A11_L15]
MRVGRFWRIVAAVGLLALPLGAEEPTAKRELEELKTQVAAQQQQIRELQEVLRRQAAALERLERQLGEGGRASEYQSASNSPPVDDPTPQASLEGRLEELENRVAENETQDQSLLRRLGSFSFSGDLRVRYEPFFQDGRPQRHRERARLRFQARARISDELSGGLRLATGNLDDPITSNQTLTGFFARKTFNLERFWLTYEPKQAPWLSVTAGKFAYPWYRTELTFDNDLNPEGFSETLSFDFSDSPLTNLTVVGFQLPFNELSSAGDSFIWGGQVQSHWRLSDRARLGLYATGMNFRNVGAIARAIDTGSLKPSLPLTNSARTDAGGNILGFAERFAYLDLIGELRYRLAPRWPLRVTLDFVNNVRASSSERSGYWAEVAVGQTAEKGDWLFGYTLMRVERDAVIGAYSFSDLRASTNVINHRLRTSYQPHKNVTFDYTLLVGRLFNPQENISLVPAAFQPLARDPFLSRMQFDVIYKF